MSQYNIFLDGLQWFVCKHPLAHQWRNRHLQSDIFCSLSSPISLAEIWLALSISCNDPESRSLLILPISSFKYSLVSSICLLCHILETLSIEREQFRHLLRCALSERLERLLPQKGRVVRRVTTTLREANRSCLLYIIIAIMGGSVKHGRYKRYT